MNYQLELKQLVDYPRCRIYREFIRTLVKDKNIRTNGASYLFYYILLCSFANYRTSNRRIEGITYTVGPGEWICPISELKDQFRFRFQHQVLSILEFFEKHHYISYSLLGKTRLVKFKIADWQKDNTALQYSYPCKKDMGVFFFPVAKVHELIGMGKCSEMDILLDLLRSNHKYGEQYYWILYYSFLCPQELRNTDEIIEKLAPHIDNISYRTFYRKRRAAIEALSTILWGFTAKETLELLNKFFPE